MRLYLSVVLAAALAGCGDQAPSAATANDSAAAGEEFPVNGQYHMVRDHGAGGAELRRLEMDVPLAASSREAFELVVAGADVGSCRERDVDIGKGSFSVKMTCDGPSGDVTIERHGSYSRDSMDMSSDTTMGGVTSRESVSYRLKSS